MARLLALLLLLSSYAAFAKTRTVVVHTNNRPHTVRVKTYRPKTYHAAPNRARMTRAKTTRPTRTAVRRIH
ncbi:MAG: hypothetical protein HYX27_25425 [Acidobacteria bacterium]|nr:hypothetical protein [Acidobacteriota bacterium]